MGYKTRPLYALAKEMSQEDWDKIFKKQEVECLLCKKTKKCFADKLILSTDKVVTGAFCKECLSNVNNTVNSIFISRIFKKDKEKK